MAIWKSSLVFVLVGLVGRHRSVYINEVWNRFLRTKFCVVPYLPWGSRGSSVSIVSGYGLDDWAIEVRSPAGAKDFSSSLCVQTSSGIHPASCTMGTGGPFPGGKGRPGRDADHSSPSSAEVENEWKLHLLSPQAPSWRVAGQLYFIFTIPSLQVSFFVIY
jgi:hypothetical protein